MTEIITKRVGQRIGGQPLGYINGKELHVTRWPWGFELTLTQDDGGFPIQTLEKNGESIKFETFTEAEAKGKEILQ